MTTGLRMTVDEYLALPEEKPYREYAYGEVLRKAMPNEEHGELLDFVAAFVRALKERIGGRSGPEIRVRFLTERGREYRLPDYSYWRPDKPRHDGEDQLPPTLALEVRSPEDTMAGQRDKCRYMRRYGVDVCWLVDPALRTVEVFEGEVDGAELGTDAVLASPLLPGLAIPVADLFAVLDD